MNWIAAIAMIVCGVMAVPSLIVSKRPDAQKLLDKIVPYQGWVGMVVCAWGLWTIIYCLIHLGSVMTAVRYGLGAGYLIYWITWLISGFVQAGLGFLLGFGLISKYALSKSPEAAKKGELLRVKLSKYQVPLGLAGIVLGLWLIVGYFIVR